MGGSRFRVVFAPDSFKGSLTSVEVARALAEGWRRARPDDDLTYAPLADGGEGTLTAIEFAGGWERRTCTVSDPIGRPVEAAWLISTDGKRAFVELAEASGLSRLTPEERDPMGATTLGTGEVLRAVLDARVNRITLGIGGSATNDGGAGILRALGAIVEPDRVDIGGLDPRLAAVDLRIACDVSNPLLGPTGAAATYGPQKGATPAQVEELDRRLGAFAERMIAATGRDERVTSGAGAAGGTAFGLLSVAGSFHSVVLVPGLDLVAEETDLASKLDGADLVVTGEGRIDAQTAFGKTALGVAQRARERGVTCIAVGGGVEPDGIAVLHPLGVTVVPVVERPQSIAEAMAGGSEPVARCGERIARLIDLGAALRR
ncbi:MAG: glycerate kinase [Chloroflexota bacterium]